MKTTVLVVEDDAHLRMGLRDLLESEGFSVVECARGDRAVEAAAARPMDLVVLDLMLPGRSGFDICRDLRASGVNVPILMLTAKSQEIDKVIGLESGADDYLTKPFGVRELIARIRALLRRSAGGGNGGSFRIGKTTVDATTYRLRRGTGGQSLTAIEMKLLSALAAKRGQVIPRDQLLNEVWGITYYGTTRTLDQTISQIRRKLGPDAATIKTVHGVGYRLD